MRNILLWFSRGQQLVEQVWAPARCNSIGCLGAFGDPDTAVSTVRYLRSGGLNWGSLGLYLDTSYLRFWVWECLRIRDWFISFVCCRMWALGSTVVARGLCRSGLGFCGIFHGHLHFRGCGFDGHFSSFQPSRQPIQFRFRCFRQPFLHMSEWRTRRANRFVSRGRAAGFTSWWFHRSFLSFCFWFLCLMRQTEVIWSCPFRWVPMFQWFSRWGWQCDFSTLHLKINSV